LGGSSGPLYGLLFLRSSSVLDGSGRAGLPQWAKALEEGIRAISELGGAKPGDRTMLDARDSFVRSLKSAEARFSREVLRIAVIEAHRGAEAARDLRSGLRKLIPARARKVAPAVFSESAGGGDARVFSLRHLRDH